MPMHSERHNQEKYRAKAWECAARAQVVVDPGKRTELLQFAAMWLSLAQPMEKEPRGAYELPPQKEPRDNNRHCAAAGYIEVWPRCTALDE